MDKVQQIVEKILEENGLELVAFNMNHGRNRSSVKILADTSQGNITLDQIAHITSTINDSDEFYAELPEDFRLEVSSPGLDYKMKTFQDFRRQQGRTVKVTYREEDKKKTLSGNLIEVTDTGIVLEGKYGQRAFSFDIIDHGKIEIKFK